MNENIITLLAQYDREPTIENAQLVIFEIRKYIKAHDALVYKHHKLEEKVWNLATDALRAIDKEDYLY